MICLRGDQRATGQRGNAPSGDGWSEADHDVSPLTEIDPGHVVAVHPETVHAVNDVSFSEALGGLVDPVGKIGLGKSVIANGGVRLQEPHRGTIGFKG